jgi:hypothetical protein
MIQETRDIRTLLAHQHDQSAATPDFRGRTQATARQVEDIIRHPNRQSNRQLRRLARQQGQP